MAQHNFHNLDTILREVVLSILAADSRTSSTDLRVGVLNGIVHLAGKVDSVTERDTVEQLVKQISGIRGVVNRIQAPGAPSPSRIIDVDLINE